MGELLVFGDYECPYTRMAYHQLQRVEAELGERMRLVWRQLPLTEIHPHALAAAGFAQAAARQGRFWALHDVLFDRQGALEDDVESARASGAQGTPTLFVDGVLHVAGFDADVLRAVLTAP